MTKTKTFFFAIFVAPYVWCLAAKAQSIPLTQWHYIQIDSTKGKWGDFAKPEWLRYFGLDAHDANGDGYRDIVSGRYYYKNPGGKMEGRWERIDLGLNVDGIIAMDVDGDKFGDIIGQALPDIYWLEALDQAGNTWKHTKIGTIPATSHVNSQGFERGDIIPGGRDEIVIAGNGNIYLIEIPDNPSKGAWPVTLIGDNSSDEGIGIGDVDGDGDLDIAAGRNTSEGGEPTILVWWENPGKAKPPWQSHEIGKSNHPIDRVEVADMNGDGKNDIVVTEERWPGLEPDANLFWFQQPDRPDKKWERKLVTTAYSLNNLDVADIDMDGDMDIITSEHKGPNPALQVWQNLGQGEFKRHIIDQGKESHLGTLLHDLDADGDLDLISAGWDRHQYVHVWRNDAIYGKKTRWKHLSSQNGDIEVPNGGNQQTATLVADIDWDGVQDFMIAERTQAPSLVWYRFTKKGWERHVVEDQPLTIEAGSAAFDIDNDGDIDVVFGGDSKSNEVWWWENPSPKFNPKKPWKRRAIKSSGENKHHDQIFGDFDGDGKYELVFWNQRSRSLMRAVIPDNPKKEGEWAFKPIYTYSDKSQMLHRGQPPKWKGINEHEGLATTDMDGDGVMDIVGGGRWFRHVGNGNFEENIIDASYIFTRSQTGQFVKGGTPEVVMVIGDGQGPLILYEWKEKSWVGKTILENLSNGHTLEVLDFDGDGNDDVFIAEMRFGEGNPGSAIRLLLGDGSGNFKETVIATGFGVHEGKIADLDGDGDYDVLGKPYTWKAPLLNIWLNEGK